ncbi:MAG: hypothetical protein HOP08_03440 [Cyclobacteriaceae bacterium]|nr:hypothetical protein [Cyclobacteriaceae bacterium]
MKASLLTILLGLLTLSVSAQSFTEKITKEFSFDKKGPQNALMVFNINGNVKVEGYSGDKILVEVERTITGKTTERLERGKQEIQLGVSHQADTIMLYVNSPCNEFGKNVKNDRKGSRSWYSNRNRNGWGYLWSDRRDDDDCGSSKYNYKMDFVIKVPMSVNVMASTINHGDLDLSNINAAITADNINGSIRLKNISGTTHASTINGSVDVDYSGNPSGDSKYYSLNGDINANFKKGLAAQLTFKSFNGDFYSSVNEITPMAVTVEKYQKGEGIAYKVNGNRYKVRQGGPLLDFETFNGDVYLREVN